MRSRPGGIPEFRAGTWVCNSQELCFSARARWWSMRRACSRTNFGRRTQRALSCHGGPCDGARVARIDGRRRLVWELFGPSSKGKTPQGGGGSYKRGAINLRAEQIWARDGRLERRGGYALGAWRLSSHWEPLARTDWLTTDIHKANTTSIAYLAGLNFYWGKHVKVGANAGAQHDQGSRGISSLFLAQTMLGF